MAIRDPDDSIVAIFKEFAVKNEGKSAQAGRPIFDDMEICELHFPGSKNWGAYPATSFSHWGVDQQTGEQVKVTYAERFRRQYQQFKARSIQTKSGTPLDYASFLTEARRAELRAQNIYTVEALAAIDGQELKNIGQGGRELKNAAMEYLDETKRGAVNTQMQSEIEMLRAKNQVMAEDLAALKAKPGDLKHPISLDPTDEFDGMLDVQLREYIKTNTGSGVAGNPSRKNLLRMARDVTPTNKENAA